MWQVKVLVVLIAFVHISWQQSCNIQSNTAYNIDGDVVTLFNVASAQACCEACAGFEECNYFSYVKDKSMYSYQYCVIKSNVTAGSAYTNTSCDSGFYNRVYSRPTQCTQESGYDYYMQANLGNFHAANAGDCCSGCAAHPGCQYWTLTGNTCYMKAAMGNRTASPGLVSGSVIPQSVVNTPKRPSGKRGLGLFGTKSCSDMKQLGNVSWVYNWSEDPGELEECLDELGIQFVPMIWGLNSHPEYVYGKSPYLLTFNEPNFPDQSNMSPQQAAAYWPKIEAVAAKYNMKISSPSASYGGSNQDAISWLDDFFAVCNGCKVDFIATHQYTCSAPDLYGAIGNFKKYQKPIWVTEFACYGDTQQQDSDFAKQILADFDGDSQIERYSWFGTRVTKKFNNIFDNSKNGLSPVGVIYAGGPASTTSSSGNPTSSGTPSSSGTPPSTSPATSSPSSGSSGSPGSSDSSGSGSSGSSGSGSSNSGSSGTSSNNPSSSATPSPPPSSTSPAGASDAPVLRAARGILLLVALYIMLIL